MEIKAFKGLKNTTSAERFAQQGYLDACDNLDIDDTGRVLSRLGTTLAAAGSYHSLWASDDQRICLVMSGTDLKRLNQDYSLTQVARLMASRRVSYCEQQDVVYLSNGVDKGRLASGAFGEWGIRTPISQPVAQLGAGSLPPGRYQYALTFRRATRAESGTSVAGMIELAAQGGISFSSIEVSSDPEVVDKCLYLSGPNGEGLYRAATLDNSVTSFAYTGNGMDLTVRLETQFENPPPPGDIVECYNGVMYVVQGSVAWHSAPYQFERFCFKDQFMPFPDAVTMFAAVNDGIYVSAGNTTWFLQGEGPGKFKSHVVMDHGAIMGTAVKTSMGVIKTDEEEPEGEPGGTAVAWASPRGVCFGMEGGKTINMTERHYLLPTAQRGAGIVRTTRGMIQYLASLEGTQQSAAGA